MDVSGSGDFDLAWCRWVASFVRSVPRLVEGILQSLGPEGVVQESNGKQAWAQPVMLPR